MTYVVCMGVKSNKRDVASMGWKGGHTKQHMTIRNIGWQLVKILKSFGFSPLPKINLIPNNPVEGLPYERPQKSSVETFFSILKGTIELNTGETKAMSAGFLINLAKSVALTLSGTIEFSMELEGEIIEGFS